MTRSHRIAATISDDLLAAIDAECFEGDETRAALIRRLITDQLRDLGRLASAAPPTRQLALGNSRYRAGARP